MNKPNTLASFAKAMLSLVLIATTTGCDGGLFGTGDGSDIVLPTDAAAPPTNTTPENPDGVITNEPASPTIPPASSDNTPFDQQFENLLITGDNELPLITLINVSSQPLNILSGELETPLLSLALAPGRTSAHVEFAEDQKMLSIVGSDSSQLLHNFSSIDLAPSTVTTLIAYDSPDTSDNPDTISALQVIALRTLTSSTDASVATLRIVQANQLGASDTSATMTLIPEGLNPGSGEVIFDSISLASAPLSNYMNVNRGSYQLQDSLNRFAPVPLNIEANTVYTLIVTDTKNPTVLIAIDSDVVIQPGAN